MDRKPILLVDFDGVIHSYTSGWKGADIIPDPPVNGAAEFLSQAVEHFHVNIYSSRTRQDGGLEAMQTWCTKWFGKGLTEELFFPKQKPAAFLTIDDRCWCFQGIFPDAEKLLNFKPWNKDKVEAA